MVQKRTPRTILPRVQVEESPWAWKQAKLVWYVVRISSLTKLSVVGVPGDQLDQLRNPDNLIKILVQT